MYVLASVNWFLPFSVSLTAIPKPLIAMTEMDPASEHIDT
jgi:hypothetical protein